MKQRESFSINLLILSAAYAAGPKHGITKTRIMQEAMLNYHRACHYLDDLAGKGLLSYDGSTRRYHINAKGREYLLLSEELAGYMQPIRNMVSKYEAFFPSPANENYEAQKTVIR